MPKRKVTQTTKRRTSLEDLTRKNRDSTKEEQKQVKGGNSAKGNPIKNADGDPIFGTQNDVQTL